MIEKDDWRLQGQEKELMGVTLYFKKYKASNKKSDHDHCEFCWQKFMEYDNPDIIYEGYTTENEYHWICEECYEDFKKMFQWNLGNLVNKHL